MKILCIDLKLELHTQAGSFSLRFMETETRSQTSTRSEEWQAALAIFCQMPDHTLDHSIGAYSAMISACHLAILLLSSMGDTEQQVIFMGKRGNMIISTMGWNGLFPSKDRDDQLIL